MNSDRLIRLDETANLLALNKDVVRDMANEGKIPHVKTPGGHRRFRLSDIHRMMGIEESDISERKVAVYCRVSSHEQKTKGDLDRQKGRLLEHCVGKKYEVGGVIQDVGSGMSSGRLGLKSLIDRIIDGEISVVIIENKDRLTRFQFPIFERFFGSHGTDIEVLSGTTEDKSFEQELADDLISIISSFSGRLYGRRSAANRRKKKASEEVE